MNLVDNNLTTLLNRLSPRERKIIADALREGAQLGDDGKSDSSMASPQAEEKGQGRTRNEAGLI